MEKVNVSSRLETDDVAFLDKLAEQLDRDRSYLINQAVKRLIAQERWQVAEVARAIGQVEAGEFLTEEQFAADMKSWRLQS